MITGVRMCLSWFIIVAGWPCLMLMSCEINSSQENFKPSHDKQGSSYQYLGQQQRVIGRGLGCQGCIVGFYASAIFVILFDLKKKTQPCEYIILTLQVKKLRLVWIKDLVQNLISVSNLTSVRRLKLHCKRPVLGFSIVNDKVIFASSNCEDSMRSSMAKNPT